VRVKLRVNARVLRDVGDAKRLAECIYGIAERGYRVHVNYVFPDSLVPGFLRKMPLLSRLLSRLLSHSRLMWKAIYLEIELEKP
jgi:hypothetical protein